MKKGVDKLGRLVLEARNKKDMSSEALAKAIDCSENYARHIASNPHTIISDRLQGNLNIALGIPMTELKPAVESRNKAGRAFYAQYRKKYNKKAAKKSSKKAA